MDLILHLCTNDLFELFHHSFVTFKADFFSFIVSVQSPTLTSLLPGQLRVPPPSKV